MRTCRVCAFVGPDERFTKQGSSRKNICKSCTNARVKIWQENSLTHKEYIKTRRYSRHGLTKEQFDHMVNLYDGKCHACRQSIATVIDHDHNCCDKNFGCNKCVRGMLCYSCNTALGLVKDDPHILVKYLASW